MTKVSPRCVQKERHNPRSSPQGLLGAAHSLGWNRSEARLQAGARGWLPGCGARGGVTPAEKQMDLLYTVHGAIGLRSHASNYDTKSTSPQAPQPAPSSALLSAYSHPSFPPLFKPLSQRACWPVWAGFPPWAPTAPAASFLPSALVSVWPPKLKALEAWRFYSCLPSAQLRACRPCDRC